MNGAFLETWVVTEILKSYWHNGRRAPLFYYRDHDLKEVDLLIQQDNQLFPIEIKQTAHPATSGIRHFQALATTGMSIGPGALICLTGMRLPLNAQVQAIAVAAL